MARKWKGLLTREGVQTGDGRVWIDGAFTWLDPPIPLAMQEDQHGMSDPVGIGTITALSKSGSDIMGEGEIDEDSPMGAEVVRRMDAGLAPFGTSWGVSVDMDDMEVEIVDNAPANPDTEPGIVVVGGVHAEHMNRAGQLLNVLGPRAQARLRAAAGDPPPAGDPMFTDAMDAVILRFTRSRIRGATLCSVPAFAECMITLEADEVSPPGEVPPATEPAPAAVVASAIPAKPPRAWFHEPEPEEGDPRLAPQYDLDTGEYIGDAVPLTILADGQLYGHVAPANRCHIGFADMCVTPPRSASAYAHFNLFSVECDDGELHEGTGPLVAGCDHASTLGLDARSAQDWYANNGLAWADVTVRPGAFGPWACGALRPGVTDELIRALRGGGISGDWRGTRDGLELVACLAVNTPGFTVQRALAAAASSIRIAQPRAMVQVMGEQLTVITLPVTTKLHAVVGSAFGLHECSCGGRASEELRLLRTIEARTRPLNVQRRDLVASRLGRGATHPDD